MRAWRRNRPAKGRGNAQPQPEDPYLHGATEVVRQTGWRQWLRRSWAWGILGLLLLAVLYGALSFDRSSWPYLVGDEATYAMQAASLAWDFDLRYTRQDYDRFLEHWQRAPDGLILQSRDGGHSLAYGKPSLYAVAVAPLVRLAPVRGAAIANALFLAAAALLAASCLSKAVGTAAPLWVAVFLFAAVPFGYTFWVHADLFLMACTGAAFALAYAAHPQPRERPAQVYDGDVVPAPHLVLLRWLAVGALAAVAGSFRPFYLTLVLPLALAVPRSQRRHGLIGLAAGALGLLLLSSLLQWHSGGSWIGYAGERQDFYPQRGYPEVDFPKEEWSTMIERWGNKSWVHSETLKSQFDFSLWGWNLFYFLIGRNVGVLPYFLPLVLGLVAFRGHGGRWAILPAVLLALAATFWLSPFNFYGGAGAIGNRYFLPLYPALWFLVGRPRGPGWPVAAALLAAPFLFPLWTHPRAFPVDAQGRYLYLSPAAEAWLPYETSQSHIPGGRDVEHNDLWLRFLNLDIGPQNGGRRIRVEEGGRGEFLIGSAEPLESLWLDFQGYGSTELEFGGAEPGQVLLRPDGTTAQEILLGRPRASHPMWWTWDPIHLYELRLEAVKGPVLFALSRQMPTRSRRRPADP